MLRTIMKLINIVPNATERLYTQINMIVKNYFYYGDQND